MRTRATHSSNNKVSALDLVVLVSALDLVVLVSALDLVVLVSALDLVVLASALAIEVFFSALDLMVLVSALLRSWALHACLGSRRLMWWLHAVPASTCCLLVSDPSGQNEQ